MNKFKEKETVKTKSASKKVESRLSRSVSSVVSGSFLTREETRNQLPFILFLTLIAMCYISNTYYAERTVRKINQVSNEIKELRSEYITTKSDLMFISKQSEVARAAAEYGIRESVVPPKKIVISSSIASVN